MRKAGGAPSRTYSRFMINCASLPGANINETFDDCLRLFRPKYIIHRIQTGRPSAKPICSPQRAAGKCDAVGRAMGDFHPLARRRESHSMLADDIARPQRGKTDITRVARRGVAMPLEHRHLLELAAARPRHDLAKAQRGARG